MPLLIFLAVIGIIIALTAYYSVIVKRCIRIYSPVLVPRLKKLYESIIKWDESVAGTKRKVSNKAIKNPERYVEVENPYKKVSVRLVGMVLSVLTLYINKTIGRFLLVMLAVCLLSEIVLFILRKKKDSKLYKTLQSLIPQFILALLIYSLFGSRIFGFIL